MLVLQYVFQDQAERCHSYKLTFHSHLQVVFPSITFVSTAMQTLLCLHALTMCKFLLGEFFYARNNLFDEICDLFLIVFLGCEIFWARGSESLLKFQTVFWDITHIVEPAGLIKLPDSNSKVMGVLRMCSTWDLHNQQLFGVKNRKYLPHILGSSCCYLRESLPSPSASNSSLSRIVFTDHSSTALPALVTWSLVSPHFIKAPSSITGCLHNNHSFSTRHPDGTNQHVWQLLHK